jgi:hypothetical protein
MKYFHNELLYNFSRLTDLGWFLGETLVGESLSSRVEVQRAGLLQRLEPHIRRSVANIMSVPKMTPQHIEMKSKLRTIQTTNIK